MNRSKSDNKKTDKLVRWAIVCTIAGMLLVLLFLVAGFRSWSVGLGIFLGMPVMLFGVALYVIAVIRDLKAHRVLDSEE